MLSACTTGWMFVLVSLLFGILYLCTVPPFMVPDEMAHFYRAYQVSTGEWVGKKVDAQIGGRLPESLMTVCIMMNSIPFHPEKKVDKLTLDRIFEVPLNPDKTAFLSFPNSSYYSPVVYLPQSLGIVVGRIFGCRTVVLMYLGRLSNLLLWIPVVFLALRNVPYKKNVMFLVATMPMTVFQASSLSADGVAISLSLLTVSYILKLAFPHASESGDSGQPDRITLKNIIVLITLGSVLSTCKGYIFILLLLFSITQNRYKNKSQYVLTLFAVFLSAFATFAAWAYLTRNLHAPTSDEANLEQQFAFITGNPLEFVKIFQHTIRTNFYPYLCQFVGYLGWLDTKMPSWTYNLFLASLAIITCFDNGSKIKVKPWQSALMVFTFAFNATCIFTLIYIQFTRVRAPLISGVQGRYFIPIAPLLLLCFNLKWFSADAFIKWICFTLAIFMNGCALVSILNRYYY